jgi:hypothetical protein
MHSVGAVEITEAELLAWRERVYADSPALRDYYADRAADAAAGLCTCCTKYAEKYLCAGTGGCDELDTIAWMLGEY